jgi:hypothetical protein
MTDLLTRPASRPGAAGSPGHDARRPLWLGAALAGVASAVSVLVICMAVALAGWFASDGGTHGDTRDALRVGADAWLLSLGAPLHLTGAEPVTISVIPLGLTALGAYVAFRLGRWAAWTSASADLPSIGLGTVVLAGTYAIAALVTTVLSASAAAETPPGRAFLGGVVVGALGGGLGLLAGSGRGREPGGRLPVAVRAVTVGGLASALLLLAAGSVLVVAALAVDLGTGANVLSRLHAHASGAALYTVVVAAFAPNAALLGSAYLVGPGFAMGTGTVVSPSVVELGPVPAFPLLAALPDPGPTPGWTGALLGVPAVVAAIATGLAVRRFPADRLTTAAARGLAAGVVGGLLTGLLVGLAGGSVGPGRMADVGAPVGGVLAGAVVAMAIGGLVGGLVAAWWQHRRGHGTSYQEDGDDVEDTVRL